MERAYLAQKYLSRFLLVFLMSVFHFKWDVLLAETRNVDMFDNFVFGG